MTLPRTLTALQLALEFEHALPNFDWQVFDRRPGRTTFQGHDREWIATVHHEPGRAPTGLAVLWLRSADKTYDDSIIAHLSREQAEHALSAARMYVLGEGGDINED